jgi:hypothetical protein
MSSELVPTFEPHIFPLLNLAAPIVYFPYHLPDSQKKKMKTGLFIMRTRTFRYQWYQTVESGSGQSLGSLYMNHRE